MAVAPQRFVDPATEKAFLRAERSERGRAIRALIIIAALTLISYLIINPMHLPPDGVIAYTAAAGTLIALMAGLFALTRTSLYLETAWLDLPVFALLGAGMAWLAVVLAGLADHTGFAPHVMVMVQLAILVIFASIGFAGTFRLFLLWALILFGLFAVWLLTRAEVPQISRVYTLTNFSTFLVFALYFNWVIERRAREVHAANLALEAERAKTEALLYNVLPQEVVARLKAGDAVADAFADITVVFVDLVDFTRLTKRLSPGHLVQLLNTYFSAADRCAERHGLEKVKTIGDAYLAVAGGMASREAEGAAVIAFAVDLIAQLRILAEASGIELKARIGAHTGPAVGGVIGSHRLAYDYWGDTLNVASRLQGAAAPNAIAVSEATYFRTKALLAYEPQSLMLKGIGDTRAYVARLGPDGD